MRYSLEGGVLRYSLKGEWVHYYIALQRSMGSVVPWTEGEVSGEGWERAGVLYMWMDLRLHE